MSQYRSFLEESFDRYYPRDEILKYYKTVPLGRSHTFQACLDAIRDFSYDTVVELGTSRSFVDGAFEGCNSDDIQFWDLKHPEKWDWSAGFFTYIFGEALHQISDRQPILHTVDLSAAHIRRCQHMTKPFAQSIRYHVISSEDFLTRFPAETKIDLLYLDTGDMTPIEETAQLHLREAKIIVERDLLSEKGFILIDDVRNITPKKYGETSDFGKAKYSLPFFLDHGYEIVMDEYQTLLKKQTKEKWLRSFSSL